MKNLIAELLRFQAEVSNRMSKVIFALGTSAAIATIYAILPEYLHPEMESNLYNVTYTATFRTVFAVAVSAMIAALYFRKER